MGSRGSRECGRPYPHGVVQAGHDHGSMAKVGAMTWYSCHLEVDDANDTRAPSISE